MKREVSNLKRILVVLILNIIFFPAFVFSIDYDHEIKLKAMSFSWKIQQEQLLVKVTAATEGWVGIGFNPSTRMQDANFIIGYVKNGKVEVTDAFGVRPKEHVDDTSTNGRNDIISFSGNEEGGNTTIEFIIPLNSGDPADGKINVNDITTVLLAFGKGQDDFHSRHRFRTKLEVNLATGEHQ
ncbi:DOMON domain-containing protein [bacterium]|nr:DOMON domain-containing protein [bacterium]